MIASVVMSCSLSKRGTSDHNALLCHIERMIMQKQSTPCETFVRTMIQDRFPHNEIRALALHYQRRLAPESVVCVERACAEITHSPGRAPAPAGAPLVAEDLPLTSRLEEQVKRDAEALARCWAGKIAGSKRRTPTRQRTVQAEIRRVARVDQSLDQRIERLADRVDAEFAAGRRPVKRAARLKGLVIQRDAERDARGVRPTPHREKMRMPEADLPDLSAAAAPLGAGERALSRVKGPPDAMAMYDRLRQARDAYHERQAVTP